MDEETSTKIVCSIDIVVSILIIIAGIVVLIFWSSLSNFVDTMISSYSYYSYSNPFKWIEFSPWIALMAAIILLIYGVERLIYNILKLLPKSQQSQQYTDQYPGYNP